MVHDHIVYDKVIYAGCACECFVKITGRMWDDEIPSDVSIEYYQQGLEANWNTWRQRIKRAWKALTGKDWLPGVEFYDETSALEFAEAFGEAIWKTFPPKAIEESDAE